MRKKILSLPLLISLSLASGHAAAVGLGQIEVQSRLNQPLVAEIRLLQVAPEELDRMHVRLASPEAFARVGLDRPSAMTANLQFSLDTNARGEPVIRVTTPNRVNDPFLSFLLEIEWGAGRLVREYNVLLDPPHMAPAGRAQVAPATTAHAPAVRQAPSAPVTSQAPVFPGSPPAPAPVPGMAPAPAAASVAVTGAGGTFTVVTGQTLSAIASRERDADVSMNQMMIALLRANPDAFIDGNINLLRAGAVMRVPTRDEVVAVRAAEANAIVSEHVAAWNARRAPVPQPAETPRQQAGRAPVAPESEARLAIVPPAGEAGQSGAQSGAAAGGEGTQLRVELTQAEEEIAARDAEIEEMRSRMDELEALAERQARMIELRSQEMDDMQRQLREARGGRADDEVAVDGQAAAAAPWYRHPLSLGGLALLVVGALVWLFARRRREPDMVGGRAGSLAASIEAARTSASAPVASDAAGDAADVLDDNVPGAEDVPEEPATGEWSGPEGRGDRGGRAFGGGARDSVDVATGQMPEDVEPVHAAQSDDLHSGHDAAGGFNEDAVSSQPQGHGVPVTGAGEPGDDPALDDRGVEPDGEPTRDAAANVAGATDFDLEEADIDSVDTKLELARAYIDIGDIDGARAMLEEVRDEGSEAQQAQARELLDGLR